MLVIFREGLFSYSQFPGTRIHDQIREYMIIFWRIIIGTYVKWNILYISLVVSGYRLLKE